MINGNCTGDANPDWWFPEIPAGRSNPENVKRVASQINYALQLCATCPVKEACLAEGMKMEKMPSGMSSCCGWEEDVTRFTISGIGGVTIGENPVIDAEDVEVKDD